MFVNCIIMLFFVDYLCFFSFDDVFFVMLYCNLIVLLFLLVCFVRVVL